VVVASELHRQVAGETVRALHYELGSIGFDGNAMVARVGRTCG
jgi:hypothetical protein